MNDVYIKNGNVFIGDKFQKTNLLVRNGKIDKISPSEIEVDDVQTYDAKGNYVVPGFIESHTHGAVNVDVNAATADDLEKISVFFAKQGTTSWQCSIVTDTKEQTLWCIEQYNKYQSSDRDGANLLGIHLEGPFLAKEYKGSMPEHLLISADMDLLKEYQEAANGDIKYITVAPEVEGVAENIKNMRDLGMVVSLGHSGADYDTTMQCIENGANSITHTFNAIKLPHQHYPGIVGAGLESDVYCEAICDGFHLHPAIVRLLIKTKGLDKVVGITDSIMAAGLPDGNYKLGVNDIVVHDGDAKLANADVRAGSTLTSGRSLKNIIKFTNRPLEEAVKLWTENPAKMLEIFDEKGSIDFSKDADLVVLNDEYDVVNTFVKGKEIN